MAGTMEASPLVVLNHIDGKQRYTSTEKLQETSLQACAAVQRLPREKLVARARQHPLPTADGGCWRSSPRIRPRGSWDASATDSSVERREGFALDSRHHLSSCTGSTIVVGANNGIYLEQFRTAAAFRGGGESLYAI